MHPPSPFLTQREFGGSWHYAPVGPLETVVQCVQQVYKARIKASGKTVAVKVQRPRVLQVPNPRLSLALTQGEKDECNSFVLLSYIKKWVMPMACVADIGVRHLPAAPCVCGVALAAADELHRPRRRGGRAGDEYVQ